MTNRRSILLDTGVLVLFVVGLADRSLIQRHKRTSSFVEEDYDTLCNFISQFQELTVTPNVLTEASNLLAQVAQPARGAVLQKLADLLARDTREDYVPSREASVEEDFLRLGLTDSVVIREAGVVDCVLTDDLNLYLALVSHGREAVNFNHIRLAGWQ